MGAFRHAFTKCVAVSTRGPRGGFVEAAGPAAVVAARGAAPALLLYLLVAGLAASPPTPPSPGILAPPRPLTDPTWADAYDGPAKRHSFRGRLAVAAGADDAGALAATLACASAATPGDRAPSTRRWPALWRPPDGADVPASCDGDADACAGDRACWGWMLGDGHENATTPPLAVFASAAVARAHYSAHPDTVDAVLVLTGGGVDIGVNATLVPAPAAGAPPPPLAPAPHRKTWMVANLAAAATSTLTRIASGSTPTLLAFKPFPWPATTTDAAAAAVGSALRVLFAYSALPAGRRAAAALAAERSGGARAALVAAGLPARVYWGAWGAAHACEAAATATLLAAGAAAAGATLPASTLCALLALLACAVVVPLGYCAAAALRGATAAGDLFPLAFVGAALPGYVASSTGGPPALWLPALVLPPSAAVLAGAAAGAGLVASREGGGWGAMLAARAAPVAGAPTVWTVTLALLALAPIVAATAAALEWALGPRPAPLPPAGAAVDGDAETAPDAEAPTTRPPTAELDNVTVAYGPVRALDGASFVAPARRVTALVGPNGAGKTTALRVLTGAAEPAAGAARVAGARAGTPGVAGVCLQTDDVWWPTLSVGELLALFAAARGAGDPEAAAAAAAESFGLTHKLAARAGELSGGQRRRLSLAAAVVGGSDGGGGSRPLLLDEPTAGLDVDARARAWTCLLGDTGAAGILVTTHALDDVDAHADSVIVVARGRVLTRGTPGALRAAAGGGAVLTAAVDDGDGATTVADTLDAVDAAVTAAVPAATRARRGPCSAAWRLPADGAASYGGLLRSLAARARDWRVVGLGLSVAPLEDAVSALLAADEEGEADGGEGTTRVSAPSLTPPPPTTRLRGAPLARARLATLTARHVAAARRSVKREMLDAAAAVFTLAFGAWLAATGGAAVGGRVARARPPRVARPRLSAPRPPPAPPRVTQG